MAKSANYQSSPFSVVNSVPEFRTRMKRVRDEDVQRAPASAAKSHEYKSLSKSKHDMGKECLEDLQVRYCGVHGAVVS